MLSSTSRSASSRRPAAMTTKSDRYRDHIGRAVTVDNSGIGILRYFEQDGDVKICGVELDEPMGDCNGEDLDGVKHFTCPENHGVYISMKEVTLLDANGQPIITKKAKPKKKFESPPSLRKKIVRKEPTSRRGDASSKPSTPKQNPPSRNTSAAGVAHQKKMSQGAKKKVDHLAKSSSGVDASVSNYANADRKIIKRNPAPKPAEVKEATADDEELPILEDENENAPVDGAKFVRQVPSDWIEAAKEKQREAEEAAAREKEAADLAAHEIRLKEANAKAAAEEEEFHRKAIEAAQKRDEKRQEAARLREEQAAARAALREEKDKKAMEEMSQSTKDNEEELRRREEADIKLQEHRAAQKARIAALMARVKK